MMSEIQCEQTNNRNGTENKSRINDKIANEMCTCSMCQKNPDAHVIIKNEINFIGKINNMYYNKRLNREKKEENMSIFILRCD